MGGNRAETPAGEGSPIEALLRAQRADAFEPGFAWRVTHRLRAAEQDAGAALAAAVQRWFVRLAPVAALAIVVFAALNLRAADSRQSVLEAVLGVPAVTVEQAYAPLFSPVAPTTEGGG